MSSEVQPKCTMRGQAFDADAGQPAADVVLHGLDVVHGHGLDLGQFRDGIGVELGDDSAQLLLLGSASAARRRAGRCCWSGG